MYASVTDILLSKTGPLGVELLGSLLRTLGKPSDDPSGQSGVLAAFLRSNPGKANDWVGVSSSRRDPLSREEFEQFTKVNAGTVAQELGVSPEEIVELTDRALYQAVQLAAPDGMRISPREAMQVDRDLENIASLNEATQAQR